MRAPRVTLNHTVESHTLDVAVAWHDAPHILLDRIAEVTDRRFRAVLARVFNEVDPGGVVRIDTLDLDLGAFTEADLPRAEARFEEALRRALGDALPPRGRPSAAAAGRDGPAPLAEALGHYLLHGAWPYGSAVDAATRPADLLAQLVAEEPRALVAMLRRHGAEDGPLRRLVTRAPHATLAGLLRRLEPASAEVVVRYLDDLNERHRAAALVPLGADALDAAMWTIVLGDALRRPGLLANRRALLRRLLAGVALAAGCRPSHLIGALRRSLRLRRSRPAPGSLLDMLDAIVAERPSAWVEPAPFEALARALEGRPPTVPDEPGSERRAGLAAALRAHPAEARALVRRLARADAPALARRAHGLVDPAALLELMGDREAAAALRATPDPTPGRVAALAQAAATGRPASVAAEHGTTAPGAPQRPRSTAPDRAPPRPDGRAPALARLIAALDAPPDPDGGDTLRSALRAAAGDEPAATRAALRRFARADSARLSERFGAARPALFAALLSAPLGAALAALESVASGPRERAALVSLAGRIGPGAEVEGVLARGLATVARERGVPARDLAAAVRDAAASAALSAGRRPTAEGAVCRRAALDAAAALLAPSSLFGAASRARALASCLPALSGIAPATLRGRVAGRARARDLAAVWRAADPRTRLRLWILLGGLRGGGDPVEPSTEGLLALVWPGKPRGPAPCAPRPRAGPSFDGRLAARLRPSSDPGPLRAALIADGAPARTGARDPLGAAAAASLSARLPPQDRAVAAALAALFASRRGRAAVSPEVVLRGLDDTGAGEGGGGLAARWWRAVLARASVAERRALGNLAARRWPCEPGEAPADLPRILDGVGRRAPARRGRAPVAGGPGVAAREAAADLLAWLDHPGSATDAATRTRLRAMARDRRGAAALARRGSEGSLARAAVLLLPRSGAALLRAADWLAQAREDGGAATPRTALWRLLLALAADDRGDRLERLVAALLDGVPGLEPLPTGRLGAAEAWLASRAKRHGDGRLSDLVEARVAARGAARLPRLLRPPRDPVLRREPPASVFLRHAGLVLVAAHLPALFSHLGSVVVAEDGGSAWRDRQAQERGVHLLRWLADARCDAPEPDLVLPKLLCGVAIHEVIAPSSEPTGHELRICASLLDMVLSRWPSLRGNSIAALREGFLQRPGRLAAGAEGGPGWRVEVERSGIDVLLDSLPWSLRVPIQWGWMPDALTIDWRRGS